MLHPTRTNLLFLKGKHSSVTNSISILKSKRQALIVEFLKTSQPYLASRMVLRKLYGEGITNLLFSLGQSGEQEISALCGITRRDFRIDILTKKIWGLEYKEIARSEGAQRQADKRGYDYRFSSPFVEGAASDFEKIVDAVLDIAEHDNKLQRLSREIINTTRRMRVLEERVLPLLKGQIKVIAQYISERERETFFRLKRFKERKQQRRS
jgi:V/A-type H+-transporting ATPase subunit D